MLNQYVFITSSSYSGSTLLAYLLGGHSRIATIGEARGLNLDLDPEQYMCSCGRRFVDCPFWNTIERKMKSKVSPDFNIKELNTKFIRRSTRLTDRLQFSNLRFRGLEKIRDAVYMNLKPYVEYADAILTQNIALAESVTEYYGKDIYLDSSKTPAAVTYLSKALGERFKVICLFRDGRAVFNSFLKRKDYPEEKAIEEWITINKMIVRKLREMDPRNVIFVRYSDLCEEPAETLERIFTFIGVAYEPQCLEFWTSEHHIIGNPMRLSLKRGIVLDDSWKQHLSPGQLELFDRIGGAYNRQWNAFFSQTPEFLRPVLQARQR